MRRRVRRREEESMSGRYCPKGAGKDGGKDKWNRAKGAAFIYSFIPLIHRRIVSVFRRRGFAAGATQRPAKTQWGRLQPEPSLAD